MGKPMSDEQLWQRSMERSDEWQAYMRETR